MSQTQTGQKCRGKLTDCRTGDVFTHLHVASSFSMRYGTTSPADLVELARDMGYSALALTDRDGLYGAVRFVEACRQQGVAPIVGVDLALAHHMPSGKGRSRTSPRRSPVKGGAAVDDHGPRVTVLARGAGAGVASGRGWAQLCHLVTDAHLTAQRGHPVTSAERIAAFAISAGLDGEGQYTLNHVNLNQLSALTVLLGPQSDVGLALTNGAYAQAESFARRWKSLFPAGCVAVEVVFHEGPPGTLASQRHALDLWRLAQRVGLPAMLSGWVRHGRAEEAITADVLDASRRMVALNSRHLDRVTLGGQLLNESAMVEKAARLAEAAQFDGGAMELIQTTSRIAAECVQNPIADIGIGAVHLPEASVLGLGDADPQQVLVERCRAAVGLRYAGADEKHLAAVHARLDQELETIRQLGYPTYFLTVATVCDLIRDNGVRVAARGSGAGSLVNFLLGISGVDPMRYGLLMERFCTPMRVELPDIDIDVESARRIEMYERIMDRFGGERVTCVSMIETYRVRHAIRDAAAALGMPPADIDAIAKAFPHIAARNVRQAVQELPELRARGLTGGELERLFDLVERLDGLPRHIAMHPCGVILSNASLADHTPMEASWLGFPMSQFDKDDVETLGFLKLDVLGIRMQSAMAHAISEIKRVEGVQVDVDDRDCVPFDDEKTFQLIKTTRTLGCFQIESPGQRELIGKLAPERFEDLIIDISLFRPGPVKSDMITPFLRARHGWGETEYLHDSLKPALEETNGVVVFHEQVLQIVAQTTGVSLAQADEVRRAMGSPQGQERIEQWWRPAAAARGYDAATRDRIWSVLAAFASFGFCKAHAAAFALPTYQSAWLKAHHVAAFVAGILTHDPGMYPKRLILADARSFGVPVLGVDVNVSHHEYRVEKVGDELGLRIGLMDVKGMSENESASLVAAAPYDSLSDFWNRSGVSYPVTENLIMVGAFDTIYARGVASRRVRVTRRDLLVELADLARLTHAARTSGGSRPVSGAVQDNRNITPSRRLDPVTAARQQAQGARPHQRVREPAAQLAFDLTSDLPPPGHSGLPELTAAEKVRAELDILGLDVSGHVMEFYRPMLEALKVTWATDLAGLRGGHEAWCAGIKVATQTPPVRSGRRVIFLTVDDGTGPADATFFEDVQGPYADTVFHSWMLLVRGVVRRTGPRGVSMRATGVWDLTQMWDLWKAGGADAVREHIRIDELQRAKTLQPGVGVGLDGKRRVLTHASGFTQSPYADIKPAGGDLRPDRAQLPTSGPAPRSLWHASPGSSGGWNR